MRILRGALAAATIMAMLAGAAAAAPEPAPFRATYSVKYSSFSVGTNRLELRRDEAPGHWILESRANASGLARLLASGTLAQTSWLLIEKDRVRPLRFRFDDGMQRKNEDIALDFDWQGGRVTGSAKGEPVDLELTPNLQDPVSVQIATMLALQAGRQPGELSTVEGQRIKTYEYRFQREERLETAAGTFDTLVYTSSREGSERVAWMWLAPELGYLAVQLEQLRKGKRLFAMYLKSYEAEK